MNDSSTFCALLVFSLHRSHIPGSASHIIFPITLYRFDHTTIIDVFLPPRLSLVNKTLSSPQGDNSWSIIDHHTHYFKGMLLLREMSAG